jgi:hypothetical protein
MDEWNTKSFTTFERWSEIFEFVRSECISLKNTELIWNSVLPFPVLVQLERVFSIANAPWTDEKSHLLAETIKAVIVTKTHLRNFRATTSIFLYFYFKQSQITSRNSFIYEVQYICPRGKNSSFNIN